jgi:two-component system NtrC family response regulator
LLRAWAEVVLGRVLLRVDRQQAEPHFEAARAGAGERLDLVFLAQIGAALARGEGRDSRRLRGALDGLVAWGDRRLLALGLADVRDLISTPALAPTPFLGTAELAVASARERALVDVAVALSRPGDWAGRWADAMRALAPALPWKYAALVGPGALELRPELESPRRLEADGWLSSIAGRLSRPAHVELVGEPTESLRLLHGLHTVALAPLPGGGALCFGFTDGGEASARVALAAEVARLLASRLESRPELDSERDDPKPFPGIVGRCPAMQHLFAEMSLVAASEAFVHVGGETGSGKGRVAQALHERSRRRNGPFVAVNASSLSDELFEAEMFGHARGAFTGAVAAREGYVAAAEGGTLFLDEVSDLSPRGQAKLLRLLQEREYRRLGESEVRRANVRIISAANVDLEERVAKGAFRADLMYRLAVVILRLPPLRERGDDLLLLARHFLRAAAARDGREVPQLPGPVAQALCRHSWPGNVRELENEMSRLVALAGAGPILAGQLSPRVCGSRSPLASERLREALLAFERSFLKEALARHQGNRARTAGSIGITRQALLGKMARLGLT